MSVTRLLWFSFLPFVLCACGSTPGGGGGSSSTISISPSSAVVGSSTVDLTITGKGFAGEGSCPFCVNSVVVWTTDAGISRLATVFVSSTQLQATLSPNLLAGATTAKITVETWAQGADSPRSVTMPVLFSVTQAPAGTPAISAMSPASAPSGSTDLTITITGSNFENYKSVAFWTTDPHNLHDHGTMLNTTFASSTEVTAVIPALLLANTGSFQIVVLTGDPMGMSDGFFGYPESNAVTFTVAP